MELQFELDNNQLLVLDVSFFNNTYDINTSLLFTFDNEGNELECEEDVNPFIHIEEKDILSNYE